MAARKKSPPPEPPASADIVRRVPNAEARSLVTIRPEVFNSAAVFHVPIEQGALVRVFPPAGADDDLIRRVVVKLKSDGAAEVRVMPRARMGKAVPEDESVQAARHESAREVVTRLVDRAHVADREVLKTYTEEILAKVGL